MWALYSADTLCTKWDNEYFYVKCEYLYDPRKTQALSVERLRKMQSELRNINTRIGYANGIPSAANTTKMRNTIHGQFIVGFPLSFQLNPIEHTTKVKSNIVSIENPLLTEHEYQALPGFFLDEKLAIVPKNWQLNSSEKNYLDSINIINEKSILLELDTVVLTEKKECFFRKNGKIETWRAHRILIRQRNFESLANKILFPKEDLPQKKSI